MDIALNPVSNIILLKLLACVDDTKLLKESVLSPVLQFDVKAATPKGEEDGSTVIKLSLDKNGRKIFLAIFCDDCNRYLNQEEKQLIMKTSETR